MTTAMVLSAGFGKRLRPFTDELAKPLMPIGDRPLLAHLIDSLARGGVRDVVLNTHHRAGDFEHRIDHLGSKVHVIHESRILGTAGAVSNAAGALGSGDVVVWNGDILAPDLDVAGLIEARRHAGVDALWVVQPRAVGSGTVGLDTKGNIVRLRGELYGSEVSGGDFIGVQVIGSALREILPAEGCLVADVALPLLRGGGRIASFLFAGAWDDVGTPAALLRANLRWLERQGVDSWRAPDARVADGVRLERSIAGAGASVLGAGSVRDSVVFPGARVRAPCERALVAPGARVDIPKA